MKAGIRNKTMGSKGFSMLEVLLVMTVIVALIGSIAFALLLLRGKVGGAR